MRRTTLLAIAIWMFPVPCLGQVWLKQSTAATVKVGPFLDSTDGVTAEDGLTIQKADVRISKNGANMAAAAADQGASDAGAAHDELGYYDISLGTGDTDTPGTLRVMISESGALPVWQDVMIVPGGLYDKWFGAYSATRGLAGTALPDAAPDAAGGLPISDAGGLDLDTLLGRLDAAITSRHASGAAVAKSPATLATADVTGNLPANVTEWKGATAPAMTGDAFARLGSPAGASVIDDLGTATANTQSLILTIRSAFELDGAVYRLTANAFDLLPSVAIGTGGITSGSFAAGAIDAAAIAPSAITSSEAPNLDAAISTRAQAGDQMDLVAAPNATAVTAIQSGLSTLQGSDLTSALSSFATTYRIGDLMTANADFAGTPPTVGSVFHELMTTSALGWTYDRSTDSLEAQSTAYVAPDNDGIAAIETTLGVPTGATLAEDIQTASTYASDANDAAGLIALTTNKLDTMVSLDGAVYQWTANALELGPAGSGEVDFLVLLDTTLAGHTTAGTVGGALQAAGASGDPLATLVPGDYEEGTAGYLIGRIAYLYSRILAAANITVTQPVSANATLGPLYQGMSYDADNLSISRTWTGPDLSAATVTTTLVAASAPDTVVATVTCTLAIDGTDHVVTIPLTSAQTAALAPATHRYQTWAVVADKSYLLFEGNVEVRRSY